MTEEEKNKVALARYNMFAPLIIEPDAYPSNREFFRMQAHKLREEGTVVINARTIERFYYTFKKYGFESLKPKKRNDVGKMRKSSDIIEQIIILKRNYPRLSSSGIFRMLKESGVTKDQISLSTVNRVVNSMPKEKKLDNVMYRYEFEHVNEMWCGDSSHGPYLYKDGIKKKLYIIALIDDASRLVLAARIFDSDNTPHLISTLKIAVSKYGRPKKFNFDNGSNYRCSQIELIAAKIGSSIHYCRPYNPEAKAKIERWFLTLKTQWMSSIKYGEFHSIEEYQNSLNEYVNKYNNAVHSSLDGLTPMQRYLKETNLVKKIEEGELDKIFLFEIERKVSIDNIVIVDNKEYEVPYKYSSKKIKIRYLSPEEGVYIVDNEEYIEIKPLDKKSNAKRVRVKLGEEK